MGDCEERATLGNCQWCNTRCDGWYCASCSTRLYRGRSDDEPWSTATQISRRYQARNDRAAEHEQLVNIWSLCDPDVVPVDAKMGNNNPFEAHRSRRIRVLLRHANGLIGRAPTNAQLGFPHLVPQPPAHRRGHRRKVA